MDPSSLASRYLATRGKVCLLVLFVFLLWAALYSAASSSESIPLFDGKSMGKWKITPLGGEGEVRIEEGQIILAMGSDMTGITWTGEFPRENYEIQLEAMRRSGHDFFCGLTFPVGDNPCSLILGGWGGAVTGLSSIDGGDASDNSTTKIISYQEGRWYRIRLRVTTQKIEAWLDQEKIVEQDLTGRRISIRPEVELSRPLGISTWRTEGALRNLSYRILKGEK
jgi:hypothetical protein